MRAIGKENWTMVSVRWTARTLSILSMLLLLWFLIGEGFNPAQVKPKEWVGLIFFPVGVVVGMIVAWWKEGVGAGITLTSLLAFYVVYGFLHGGPLGGWFIVFAAPAFFFLLYWIMSRSQFAAVTS